MSDLEERLRKAIDDSVADIEPDFDVMEAVRRRHRRRVRRFAAVCAASVAVILVAVVLLGAPRIGPGHPASRGTGLLAPSFPGGGRLLIADGQGLDWYYPDGRVVRIARGFNNADLAAGRLVAWNKTGAYVMNLDGSRRRLVLPFTRGKQNHVIGVSGLSPDGTRLAYYVGTDPVVTGDTLWVLDLATGQRSRLGRVSSAEWRDNTTILASSADGKAVLLINAETGSRTVYLRPISDRLLVRAYQRAQPGAGRPVSWYDGGFSGSGSSAAFAVGLAATGPYFGKSPAVVVMLGGGRVVTYSPPTPQQFTFAWGPGGLFLIQTGAGDSPDWNSYVGTIQNDRLARPIRFGMDGAFFNPAGNAMAFLDGNVVTFLPTPRPACLHTARCLHFPQKTLTNEGTPLAWAP